MRKRSRELQGPARRTWVPILLFTLGYLLWASITFRDYGMTWDEADVYTDGTRYYDYFIGWRKDKQISEDVRFNGQSFWYSMFLCALNGRSHSEDYERYHLSNMFMALPLFLILYFALERQTRRRIWALAAPVFLFLTPVFLGHVPANPKDIPFAVAYNVTLMTMFLTRRWGPLSAPRILLVGAGIGLSSSLRLVGLSLLAVHLLFDLWVQARDRREAWGRWAVREAFALLLVLAVSQAFLILTWPFVGKDYFHRLLNASYLSARFDDMHSTFYLGRMIDMDKLPWHYLIVDIFFRLPLHVLALSLLALLAWKRFRRNDLFAVTAVSLLLQLTLWFLVRPSIYHGSRHYLFVYPQFVLLAAIALIAFVETHFTGQKSARGWPRGAAVVLAGYLFLTGVTTVALHPYQSVYFNELIGGARGASRFFELDYWGQSIKEAVRWIEKDAAPGRKVRLFIQSHCVQAEHYLTKRMELTPFSIDADWDYAVLPMSYAVDYGEEVNRLLVRPIERMGGRLHGVYKR